MPKTPPPHHAFRPPPDGAFAQHEVLLTLPLDVRLPITPPHYLSVSAQKAAPLTTVGVASIDAALAALTRSIRSIARVFVPRSALTPGASLKGVIGADYSAREERLGLSRTYRVTLAGAVDVERLAAQLEALPVVQRARPNHIARTQVTPDDALYDFQWGMPAIRAEAAWDLETGHPELLCAVVDSGADLTHEDLVGRLAPGQDFVNFDGEHDGFVPLGDTTGQDDDPSDEDGHGTHCAGTIACASNNNEGVVGLCWGGRLQPVRVMFRAQYPDGEVHSIGTAADIDAGIKYAVDSGAHVINLSFGTTSEAHEDVLRYAHERGAAAFAATGNEDTTDPRWPAVWSDLCLAVGAVDSDLKRASFSNHGEAYGPFVVAPGVGISSTTPGSHYQNRSGTSMATPFVCGVAGLVQSVALRAGRRFDPDAMYDILRTTARPLGGGRGDPETGQGLIDARAAVEAAQARLGDAG